MDACAEIGVTVAPGVRQPSRIGKSSTLEAVPPIIVHSSTLRERAAPVIGEAAARALLQRIWALSNHREADGQPTLLFEPLGRNDLPSTSIPPSAPP